MKFLDQLILLYQYQFLHFNNYTMVIEDVNIWRILMEGKQNFLCYFYNFL